MKKVFMLLGLILLPLLGQSYNEHILKIEAHIIPKIILMDYQFESKLVNEQVSIVILYNDNEKYIAQKIADFIAERYPEGIKNYAIAVRTVAYSEIGTAPLQANLFYLMDSRKENIRKAVALAKTTHALLFTHDRENLAEGAHISLILGKKITPLLNLKSLKAFDISVRPALLTISEIHQ